MYSTSHRGVHHLSDEIIGASFSPPARTVVESAAHGKKNPVVIAHRTINVALIASINVNNGEPVIFSLTSHSRLVRLR